MIREVEVTDQFVEWWHGLTADQQESVTARVALLAERGPDLGRPTVERTCTTSTWRSCVTKR